MIINADAIQFAKEYEGKPFSAILTDPPYNLASITKRFGKEGAAPAKHGKDGAFTRTGAGFMGKVWDSDIAFQPETWEAFKRILYPGAFGMAFGGSRTSHRMATAIESAGFIIHPMIAWVYGCLSEDTEILTIDGWKTYDQLSDGYMVACYNIDTELLEYMPIEKTYIYDYSDTAYRIQSNHTDQIVSRNHRCIIEQDGEKIFQRAETLERQESIPILESMFNVPNNLLSQRLQTKQKRIMQSRVHEQCNIESQHRTQETSLSTKRKSNYLPRLQERSMETIRMVKKSEITNLFLSLQRYFTRRRMGKTCSQSTFSLVKRSRGKIKSTYDWFIKSSMERRSHLSKSERKLQKFFNQIRTLPQGIFNYGAQRRLYYGTSLASGTSNWSPFNSQGSSTSYQSQSRGQPNRKSNALFLKQRSQKLRTQWRTTTDLATITPFHYEGIVWCVKVPTGAFVARRNGKVFVTGNSGFPKATRIDTQIDKMANAKRKVVKTIKRGSVEDAKNRGSGYLSAKANRNNKSQFGYGTEQVTEPATDLAKSWEGHRYGAQAMKPSMEPIIVFQKPYEGKPVENIIETGAGALNIDGGRISGEPWKWGTQTDIRGGGYGSKRPSDGNVFARNIEGGQKGRWPANYIQTHSPQCKRIRTQSDDYQINRFTDGAKPFGDSAGHEFDSEEVKGETEVWECVEGCPVRAINLQSGNRPGSGTIKNPKANSVNSVYKQYPGGRSLEGTGRKDSGGAGRFFHQSGWEIENADPFLYQAKSANSEREDGLIGNLPCLKCGKLNSTEHKDENNKMIKCRRCSHPTVKPIALNQHLATLLLPPPEYAPRRIFVPFSGVASEMIGAMLAGWEEVVGVEMTEEYVPIAEARFRYWKEQNAQIKMF